MLERLAVEEEVLNILHGAGIADAAEPFSTGEQSRR
jgi:hypothetical protein